MPPHTHQACLCFFLLVSGRYFSLVYVKCVFGSVYLCLWVSAGHYWFSFDWSLRFSLTFSDGVWTSVLTFSWHESFIHLADWLHHMQFPSRPSLVSAAVLLPTGLLGAGDVWDRRRWLQVHPPVPICHIWLQRSNIYITSQISTQRHTMITLGFCTFHLCAVVAHTVLSCFSKVMNIKFICIHDVCGVYEWITVKFGSFQQHRTANKEITKADCIWDTSY